ncbi:MAG TPA: hypothetical protein VIM53_05135 [Candidatus Saccharimonadales bacterium]
MSVEILERTQPQLDQSIIDQVEDFRSLPLVEAANVFGRGSVEKQIPQGDIVDFSESERATFDEIVENCLNDKATPRELSEAGKQRVRAIGAYALAHEAELKERATKFNRPVLRVLFSCGYAAASAQTPPPEEYREARMMMDFAKEMGMVDYFAGLVEFDEQIESSTTIGDAVYAAESSFLPRGHGGKAFSPNRRLGVVSHPDHMARCVDAARWAFRLKEADVLEINAQGEDLNTVGTAEKVTRWMMRIGTFGTHHSHERLLNREALILRAVLFAKRMKGGGSAPAPQLAAENV